MLNALTSVRFRAQSGQWPTAAYQPRFKSARPGVARETNQGTRLGNEADAAAWKTSQGSSLGEFSALPRLPAARRDGDGSIVVGGYEIDTGASLSVMNQRLLLAAILAILAAGHVHRTIRCIFHRNHALWILKRQGRP